MAKFIHTADLHIKDGDEKPYCFAVLDEIIALALSEKADFLLVSGDLFDSYADFDALRRDVGRKLYPLHEAGCRVIYIPGNHEGRGAAADLSAFSLDPIQFYARPPFVFFEAAGVEFVCVPHAADYDGYRGWKVPAKKPGAFRVAMVHALNSTIYTGPDEETDSRAGAIEDDFFARFAVDYAAMGHVHSGRSQQLGGAVACYPGSPRVWRAHQREAGPRTVSVVETSPALKVRQAEIKAAGQYKEYTLPAGLDGAVPLVSVQRIEAAASANDFIKVKLTGLVEDENAAQAAARALEERLKAAARRAEVELDTTPASRLSDNGLARAFLAEIDALKPEAEDGPDYSRWLMARQYGLEEIAARAGEAE
jgi:DNA repair exonuclease SbcCD nuclease subunit